MLGEYKNRDRRIEEPGLEPVDALLFTLDGQTYLEKCLDSLYKEVPVNKLIVVDGGSKDKTVEILNKYPRVEINIRPDFKTTGKGWEFIFSRVTTPWFVFIDDDMELGEGWYDEMSRYKDKYDYFESKRIMHYEFYRDCPGSTDMNQRSYAGGQFGRLDCFKNFHVDDDYMWGATDLLLKQVAEKNGYKYGKVATAFHTHHTTDEWLFESDPNKKGRRLVFQLPTWEILNKENLERMQDNYRKAIVKYLEPEAIYPVDRGPILEYLRPLDLEWVKKTNLRWYDLLLAAKKNYLWRRIRKIAPRIITLPSIIIRDIKKAYAYIFAP